MRTPTTCRSLLLALAFGASLTAAGCKGDMVRDEGGGQGDGGTPGREVDDAGLDGRTLFDGDVSDGALADGEPGDGALCGDGGDAGDGGCAADGG